MSSFVRQEKKKKERPGIRKNLSSLFHKELSKRFTTKQKCGDSRRFSVQAGSGP